MSSSNRAARLLGAHESKMAKSRKGKFTKVDLWTPENGRPQQQQQQNHSENTKTWAQITAPHCGRRQLPITPHQQPLVEPEPPFKPESPLETVCELWRGLFLHRNFRKSLQNGYGEAAFHHGEYAYFGESSVEVCPHCPLCRALREASIGVSWSGDMLPVRENVTYDFSQTKGSVTFCHRSGKKRVIFDFATNPGSPLWNYVKWRPPEVNVNSLVSVNSAKTWLRQCDELHSACPRRDKVGLPRRVLDVEVTGTNDIRLYSGSGYDRYACLSYCWGKSNNCKTEKHNVDQHHKSIPLGSLPKTLRDAVAVTRKLNIRYLWVDSLCIVQDDDKEREEQLGLMGRVYQNAYITISAACATDASQGFLHRREARSRAGTKPFPVPCSLPEGGIGRITLYQRASESTKEPIHSRGWTLQEDILSSRVLFFGDVELSWKCDTCPQQISSIEGDRTLVHLRKEFSKQQQPSIHPTPMSFIERYDKQASWEDVMVEFSRRSLGRPSDKIPAIAGLAERVSRILPKDTKYLAGLWSSWLVEHLAWRMAKDATGTRHQEWRAPTWSWLSVDGLISLGSYDRFRSLESDHEPSSRFALNIEGLADVLSYDVVPQSLSQPFGRLERGASIQIRGFCFQDNREATVILDTPLRTSDEDKNQSFWCLVLISTTWPSMVYGAGPFYCGLVLRPSQENLDGYERVGWFRTQKCGSCIEGTVKIY